jgi:hypothetical protein
VLQCRTDFLPTSRLETAVGVDPDLSRVEDIEGGAETGDDFVVGRDARRVDIVDTETDPFVV